MGLCLYVLFIIFTGRKDDYSENEPSQHPFEYPVKMSRQMPARPQVREHLSEQEIFSTRTDNHAPLFRETVEQVLDNRNLKTDGRKHSEKG